MTPQNVLCLIIGYLLCALSIICWYLFVKYWGKVQLYGGEFLYKLGFIGGALVDVACQLWIDIKRILPWKTFNERFPGHEKDAEDIF